MAPADRPATSIEFGRFKILVQRRELLADGHPVDLGGRTFDLLMTLIEARGTVVSKTDLMSHVWPGRIVEENNLQAGISVLRKIFGADRDLIRTVAGRGYQFVRDIRESAPAPVPAQLTNLPAPTSLLISREAALSDISTLVMEHRLLTLSGAGGIGKTRLAVEAARSLLPQFPDGVWIADLGPLSDPGLVPATVAIALGLSSPDLASDRVASSVRTKHILVLLDNCEHVISVAARMAEQLARAGPKVFVLCTSREPLRVEGEWVYQVPPLDVPEESALTLEEVLTTGAAKLFVMLARAVQPDFQLDASVAAKLGAICRCLDGMPLAIEFAAARAAVLGIEQIALRLDNRFRLLTGGSRTALPRHQTLRATLDWSYELLAETERRVLCHLGVFAGEFTLEAASAILSDTEVAASEVIEHVASLVQKSLLSVRTRSAVARYRMLETTRAYALERLAERGELQRFTRRHAQYHLTIFKRATEEWKTRPVADWSSDYCRLINDARVALDWAFSADGDPAMGAELTVAVARMWFQLSLMQEWAKRVKQALRVVTSGPYTDPRLEMQLRVDLGTALWFTRGSEPEGETACTDALAIAERLDDRDGQLAALHGLHLRRLGVGECRTALSVAQRFCGLAAMGNDTSAANRGDALMSHLLLHMGDQNGARRHIDAILSRESSETRGLPFAYSYDDKGYIHTLARVLWFQGFSDRAVHIMTQSVDAAIAGHAITLLRVLVNAWQIAVLVGDWVQAQRYVKLLLDLLVNKRLWYETWHGHVYETLVRGLEAGMLIKRGQVDCGVQALRAALLEYRKAATSLYGAFLTVILAEGLSASGQVAAALTVIDEALAESDATEARWYMAEQLRIKGELILLTGAANAAAEAESCYAQSLDLARHQGALSWELRTATSLARLRQRQGRTAEAMEVLHPVYARFTEGFRTADLMAVSTLLGTLQGTAGAG